MQIFDVWNAPLVTLVSISCSERRPSNFFYDSKGVDSCEVWIILWFWQGVIMLMRADPNCHDTKHRYPRSASGIMVWRYES